MEISLSIRGIYTTALTKFFMDHGLTIVSPSKAVIERLGDYKKIKFRKPAGVEIRDLESGQGILLKGDPHQLNFVVNLIKENFFDVIFREIDDQPYSLEVEFPYLAKSGLDELRNQVVPTVLYHHRLRLINSQLVDLIETTELLYHPEKRKVVSKNLEKRLLWDTFMQGKEIGIEHVKLSGQFISLSEGEIVECDWKKKKLILKRTKFKGRSKYDGLNISKKEGDYAISEVKEGDWFYKHTYFRQDGELIGEYFNINTPVEFYPDKIRYVDLEIDVVKWPDGKVEIIDEEELNRYAQLGYPNDELQKKAKTISHQLRLSSL